MTETIASVQWANGRITRVSDGGTGTKRAITVAANAATTEAQAIAAGEAALAELGARDSITATLADVAEWPDMGDAVTVPGFAGSTATERLVARQFVLDGNGLVELRPTFRSQEEELALRAQIAVDRMATGVAGGRSSAVSPLRQSDQGVPSGVLRPVTVPPWSFAGLDNRTGHDWRATTSVILTKVELLLEDAALPEDLSVNVLANGSVVANVDLPAGETHWATLGGLLLVGGSTLRCDLLIGSNDPADMTDHGLTVQFTAAPADMHVGS